MSIFSGLYPITLYKGEAIYKGKDEKRGKNWLYKGKHYSILVKMNPISGGTHVKVYDSKFCELRTELNYEVGQVKNYWDWGEPSPARLMPVPRDADKAYRGNLVPPVVAA